MKRLGLFLLFMFGISLIAPPLRAQMPRTMSFQGVLADASGGLVADGNYSITIRLYDAPVGGAPVYSEQHASVTVVKGIMNVIIGSQTPLPQGLQFNRAYFLGVSVNNGAELVPRTTLTAAPYALNAATADLARALAPGATGVVTSLNGGDGSLQLRGGGTTTINRSGNTITISSGGGGTGIQGVQSPGSTLEVSDANGPVASLDLADNAVTTAKIADKAVTKDKLGDDVSFGPGGKAGGDLTGDYPNPRIGHSRIVSENIADGAITGDDISPASHLRAASLMVSGNVGIGTELPEAHLTVQGPGGSNGIDVLMAANVNKEPLFVVNEGGKVGIGTRTPRAGLEVGTPGPIGLWVSHGSAVFSHVAVSAAPAISMPDSATVVRITNDGIDFPSSAIMPQGRPGQFMIIVNEDVQAVTVPPGTPILPGQARMFVFSGNVWRVIE